MVQTATNDGTAGLKRKRGWFRCAPAPIRASTDLLLIRNNDIQDRGNFKCARFCPPAVADGKVFLPTYGGPVNMCMP
jgi:hypothetical protein